MYWIIEFFNHLQYFLYRSEEIVFHFSIRYKNFFFAVLLFFVICDILLMLLYEMMVSEDDKKSFFVFLIRIGKIFYDFSN